MSQTHSLLVLRMGAPWADVPSRCRPHTTCVFRFNGWRRTRVWKRILNAVSQAYAGAI
jgi:transposase